MSKYTCKSLFAVLAAGLFGLASVSHAEVRLGVDYSYIDSKLELDGAVLTGSVDDKASGFGIFGQVRTAKSNPVSWGVHLGYSQSGAEYERLLSQTAGAGDTVDDLASIGISVEPAVAMGDRNEMGTLALTETAEQDSSIDLLGLVAWNRSGVTPFLMLGYSQVDVDAEATLTGSGFNASNTADSLNASISAKDDAKFTGYKFVAGIEGGDQWVWHAALEYADYGDETVLGSEKIELDSLGLRLGVAYRF